MTRPFLTNEVECKARALALGRTWATILLFAAAFFLLQRLTFALRFPPFDRTTIWTPGAILFTALLLTPTRCWWKYYVGLCLGAFSAYHGDAAIPARTALLAAQFHFGAVVLGALAMRRYSHDLQFENLAALTVFVVNAGLVVPIATTAPVDLFRWVKGADAIGSVALRSVLCVSLGLLIATPALTLTLSNGRSWIRDRSWRRVIEFALIEFALIGALLMLVGNLAFGRSVEETLPAMLYAPIPLLLWAALRFGLAGACWMLLALAYQSTWGAIHGNGPFIGGVFSDNVLQLQLFLLAISLPMMFLAVVIDQRSRAFTALAENELQLQSQYAQLRNIYQTAPVGLAFVDPQLQFVSINNHLAEMLGISASDHLGKTLRQVLPDLADEIEPVYRQVLETGQAVLDREVHGVTAAEPQVERDWLVSRYPVSNSQGSILGVNTVVREITEQKRSDRLRQDLIHASRVALLGEFTASIAHEINQPLGAILSNADAAEMLLDASPTSLREVQQILGDIRRDSLRASEFIRRLRGLLTKRESIFEPIDLGEVVQQAITLIHGEARRREIELQAAMPQSEPVVVLGDRILLQQVLVNLVVNSMEAIGGQAGERKILVRVLSNNGDAEVSVNDTGPGIPVEQISLVFDHYYSTKKEGMGLGLAITRTLVEHHGGRIGVESVAGAGATFCFLLPVHLQSDDRTSTAEREYVG